MSTIWKFPFSANKSVVIEMPKGAQILPYVAAASNQNLLVIWAIVNDDPDHPKEDRILRVQGTGMEMPEGVNLSYIGTVPNGPFIWHVFEQIQNVALEVENPEFDALMKQLGHEK